MLAQKIIPWQGWQVGNRTLDDDIEVDIEEIRQLLAEGDVSEREVSS
jgi:hypothetical protein